MVTVCCLTIQQCSEQDSTADHQRWQPQQFLVLQALLQQFVGLQALVLQQAPFWGLIGSFWQPLQVQHVHAPSFPHALHIPSSTGKLTRHQPCCLQQVHVHLVRMARAACYDRHFVSSEQ